MSIHNDRVFTLISKQLTAVFCFKTIFGTYNLFSVFKLRKIIYSTNCIWIFRCIVRSVTVYRAVSILIKCKITFESSCDFRINRNRKCSADCMNESIISSQLNLKIWAFLLYNLNFHLCAWTAVCIIHIRCWDCIYFLSVLIWKCDCFIIFLLCGKVRNFVIQCKFILSLCTFENYVFFNACCSDKILQVNIVENTLIQSFCCYIFKRSKFIITACFFVIFLYISFALACIVITPADFISVWLQWNHIFWLSFIWKIDRNITAFVCIWRITCLIRRCSLILR